MDFEGGEYLHYLVLTALAGWGAGASWLSWKLARELRSIRMRSNPRLEALKSEFVATVSHELRTPLTSIGGYAKLLLSGDTGELTETQSEFLGIIDSNVSRLSALINDLLDVEKMESVGLQIAREPQDLVSILQECRRTFEVLASQKALELRWKVPKELRPVLGDRARLVQAFMNLLSNAIKYTPSGWIEISAEQNALAVTITIRDSGVGMSKEEQENLFQKFYRARSGDTSVEKGTGLGLVICRGIVEAHQGKIQVQSERGAGTAFSVVLPAIDLKHEVVVEDTDAEDFDVLGGKSVWIVYPDERVSEKMRLLLEYLGIQVREFRSAREVGETTENSEQPDLVVWGDGESANRVPKRFAGVVPILVVGQEVDAAAAFAQGAQAVLSSTWSERDFLSSVHRLLLRNGWRVLVADPDTDLRILMKRSLEQKGFEVDDVDSGKLALDRLGQQKYDLALIDFFFPDVPGLEVMRLIRRNPQLREIPVFVMMDEGRDPPSREVLASCGAERLLEKHRGIDGAVEAVMDFYHQKEAQNV